MKLIKIYSSDGKTEIECHPNRLQHMLKNGWTEKPPTKQIKQKVKDDGNN